MKKIILWLMSLLILLLGIYILLRPSYYYSYRNGVMIVRKTLWNEKWHCPDGRIIDPVHTSLLPIMPELGAAIPRSENPYNWAPSPTLIEQAFLSRYSSRPDCWYLPLDVQAHESTNDSLKRIARNNIDAYCSYNDQKKRLQNNTSEGIRRPADGSPKPSM